MVYSCCSGREFLQKECLESGMDGAKGNSFELLEVFFNNRLRSCNPLSLYLYSFGKIGLRLKALYDQTTKMKLNYAPFSQ